MPVSTSVVRIYDPATGLFNEIGANGQRVNVAASVLPTGAASETTLAAISGKLPATIGQKAAAASLAVVLASDQGTVPTSLASVPLPAGASTETTLAAVSGKLPSTLGQKAMAASLAVVIASDQGALPVTSGTSSTAALASVTSAITTAVLLAANASRKGVIAVNDSNSSAYVAYAATATTAAYTNKLLPGATWEMPTPIFTGALSVIWDTANGSMKTTELT